MGLNSGVHSIVGQTIMRAKGQQVRQSAIKQRWSNSALIIAERQVQHARNEQSLVLIAGGAAPGPAFMRQHAPGIFGDRLYLVGNLLKQGGFACPRRSGQHIERV